MKTEKLKIDITGVAQAHNCDHELVILTIVDQCTKSPHLIAASHTGDRGRAEGDAVGAARGGVSLSIYNMNVTVQQLAALQSRQVGELAAAECTARRHPPERS